MLKVDQLDVRILFARQFVLVDLGPVQKLEDRLVGLQQAGPGVVEDLVVQLVELPISKPGLAVIRQIDGPNGPVEGLPKRDLPEIGPPALGRVGWKARPLVDDPPAQGGELAEQRLFDVLIFGHVPVSCSRGLLMLALPMIG